MSLFSDLIRSSVSEGSGALSCELATWGKSEVVVVQRNQLPLAIVYETDVKHAVITPAFRIPLISAASRLLAPFIVVANYRSVCAFNSETEGCDNEVTVLWSELSDAVSTSHVHSDPALRAHISERLRTFFLRLNPDTPAPFAENPAFFLACRLSTALHDIIRCTQQSPGDISQTTMLAAFALAYSLRRAFHEPAADILHIPLDIRSPSLALEIIAAYANQEFRSGLVEKKTPLFRINVSRHLEEHFCNALSSLIAATNNTDLAALSNRDLCEVIDTMAAKSAILEGYLVPSPDVIDAGIALAGDVLPDTLVEAGSSLGRVSIRVLRNGSTKPAPSRQYRPPTQTQSIYYSLITMLEPSIGEIQEGLQGGFPTLLTITLSNARQVRILHKVLSNPSFPPTTSLLLFVPRSFADKPVFAGIRQYLANSWSIMRIVSSDVEAFTDGGEPAMAIVARRSLNAQGRALLTTLRRPLSHFYLPAESVFDSDPKRWTDVTAFVAYIASAEARLTAEMAVQPITMQELSKSARGGWNRFLVPPDILSRIIAKVRDRIIPLEAVADVGGGLRSGANEFFMPTLSEISETSIPAEYWRRNHIGGSLVDNTILTEPGHVVSVGGNPNSERRLLLIRERGIRVPALLERITKAEEVGINKRSSFRNISPWYAVETPPVYDLIASRYSDGRRIVSINANQAFITDAFVGVSLHDSSLVESIALWLNSTVCYFLSTLFSASDQPEQGFTVQGLRRTPVPAESLLTGINGRHHRSFLLRSVKQFSDEIRDAAGAGDRRALDAWFMENVFGFSTEEQAWIYRLAIQWWKRSDTKDQDNSSNVLDLLIEALIYEIEHRHRVRPLRSWYSPMLENLSEKDKRTVLPGGHAVNVQIRNDFFAWQVTYEVDGSDQAIDCSTVGEAEIISMLLNAGKRHAEVPVVEEVIDSTLTELRTFFTELDNVITTAVSVLPDRASRAFVADRLRASLTEL